MTRFPFRWPGLVLLAALTLATLSQARAAPANVAELRVQKVGDVTYFHVRLDPPRDLVEETERFDQGFFAEPAPSLAPRLIAPEGQLRLICERINRDRRGRFGGPGLTPERPVKEAVKGAGPRQSVPVQGLEFVGRTEASGVVKAKLVYPIPGKRPKLVGRLSRTPPKPVWQETEVVLDFSKAKEVPVPAEAAERKEKPRPGARPEVAQPPVRDDLEGLWAVAQVDQFNGFDSEVRDFGFYAFAATATARKYGLRGSNFTPPRLWGRFDARMDRGPGGQFLNRELYETTTGAAAIAESLQLRRMTHLGGRDEVKRTIPIAKVRGIDIAEHPWEKMMGEKKPAPEPFARLVPHDNYYVHFKRIDRFLEFNELLDQWGTNVTRAYEVTSRDNRLKERYQEQLCLRSTALGKTLGPFVIRGVGITGSDAYLREGSDVTVLFQVVRKEPFLAAVEPFLTEARKKWGDELQERKADYHDVKIESFVTPLREVSLHRASVDDFVIYSNSPVGVRRVLDAYQGRGKRLEDSLDFKYMRTVFRYDDKEEDGFAFLSDAFIRALVGPASKIKERRRLEALTSLHMLTNGALYAAWETGKTGATQASLMGVAGLERDELPMPEGSPCTWDPKKQVARSDAYNTLHFATPLIELPINDVTKQEADEYERFRLEYLGLWRQYFDPIGMRVSIRENKVKLDTYILPLIENTTYNELRRVTGQKSVRFDPGSISRKTLAQYVLRLSSDMDDRRWWLGGPGFGPRGGRGDSPLAMMLAWAALDPIGEWMLVRLDDSPAIEKLYRLMEKSERGEQVDFEEVARTVWTLPVAVGVDMRNPLAFAGTLATMRTAVLMSLPGAVTWGPMEKDYKGVSIVCVKATPAGREMLGPIGPGPGGRIRKKDAFLPAVYYAVIDGGFYLTLNEEMLHGLIDQAVAKREKKDTVEVSSSLYLSPAAAEQTQGLLRHFLEHQTYQQARTSLPIWYALYRTGVVAEDATPERAAAAAYRYLGFVPVSPDGTTYKYDRKYDEVVNERHGSIRRPSPQKTTAEDSPLNFLLEQLRSVRADLRFREDGVHTVLTIERGKPVKAPAAEK